MTEETVTAAEYADSVRAWLQQMHQMQAIAYSFPTYLAYQSLLQRNQSQTINGQGQTGGTGQNNLDQFYEAIPGLRRRNEHPQPEEPQQLPESVDFLVPPLWKRCVAEIIDFVLLFVFKLVVTFIVVEWLNLVDLDRYDISMILGESDMDFNSAMEFTSDFVFLELIYRVVVCLYETVFTASTVSATPGKYAMGLKIVTCHQVTFSPERHRIRVTPARKLSLFSALVRSLVKNAALAFLFPAVFTLMFLTHNRTVYDIMSKSIVVVHQEDNDRRR